MTANTSLRVSELDFVDIRSNLKNFLQSQNEFTDFNFEGAGIGVLLDILAYNTHYMAIMQNMQASESFLDSAQLRDSIISHGKATNYVPSSRRGATTKVNIQVTPNGAEDNTATSLTIAKNTRFLSSPINGNSYNFNTINSNTAIKANGTFVFSNIAITQGEAISRAYLVTPDNPQGKFTIPSANIDTSTLLVRVQQSSGNTQITSYTQAADITQITGNDTVYFVGESSDANGYFNLSFGDGIIGKNLSNGNIVLVNYLDTQAFAPNGANSFTLVDSISGYSSNVIVSSTGPAYGGSEKEDIETIRYRAPIHRTIQNRAVIETDYEELILKDYPKIQAVSVWGGEKRPSSIWESFHFSDAR